MGGFLSNFAAGAANTASDLYAKSSILDQQQAAELMKAQRIAEMQQQFKIQDEQRHEANAKRSGAEIEAEAQGMLTRGQNAQVKGLYGADGADLTDADISDEERNAFQPDEADKIKAGAAAARKLGKLDAAKEYDTAYRGMVADKRADNQDKINNRRVDAMEKKNDILEQYQQRREERLANLDEIRSKADSDRANAADRNAARQATVAAMKDAREQAKQVEMELKIVTGDAMMDEKVKKDLTATLQKQLANLNREAGGYRKLLGSDGISGGDDTPAAGTPNPLDFLPKPPAAAPAKPPAAPAVASSPAAAPQTMDKNAIITRIGDIEAMLKDPAMSGKERLMLEKRDLERQLQGGGGLLSSVQSLNLGR